MKKLMTVDFDNTEWLYAPGFTYHRYDDLPREFGLIFPYRREWKEDTKYPLIVYIPGAAWHRQEMYNDVPKFSRLAEKGVVFAIVQVRESDIAPFPAQLEDIHRAVAWLIEHSEQFHIDTDRIFLAGGSSGGHLALMTAFAKCHGKYIPEDMPDYSIAGIITQAAASDIKMCQIAPWRQELGMRPSASLMGTLTDEEFMEKADAAVCKNYVCADTPLPPVLMFHFTDDPIVDCQMSRDLHDILVDTGHEAEFYEITGSEHGGNAMWSETIVGLMENFISRH